MPETTNYFFLFLKIKGRTSFLILLAAIRLLNALPVVSEISIIGGDRGIALSLSGDEPFTAEFSGKHKSVSILLKGCVYGLPEFTYDKFPDGSPLRNITAKEKNNSTVELTVNLKTYVKSPIKAVRKNSRWMALLSDEPVLPFNWNSSGASSMAAKVNPPIDKPQTNQKKPVILENIRLIRRGQISVLSIEFDGEAACSLYRKGNAVNISVENARSNTGGKNFSLPASSVFKRITLNEYEQKATAIVDVSVYMDTAQIEPNFNIAFTKGKVLSLFVMNRDNRKATLWSSSGGLSLDYNFYDVPSYNVDYKSMEMRAINDINRKISSKETFYIKEHTVFSRAAEEPAPSSQSVETLSTVAENRNVVREAEEAGIPMRVNAANLNLRISPSLSAKPVGKLVRGDTVKVVGKQGEWSKVKYKGLSAYVFSSYLVECAPADKTVDKQISPADSQIRDKPVPLMEQSSTITMVSSVKTLQQAESVLPESIAPNTFLRDTSQTGGSESASKRVIRYNRRGRDPFMPIVPSSVSAKGLPFVENLALVGILFDDQDRIALCEDVQNENKPFVLREYDPVERGKVLKIYRDKIVFLLTEYGISRSFTLELYGRSPGKEVSKK